MKRPFGYDIFKKTMKTGIAADHGGYELKETLAFF